MKTQKLNSIFVKFHAGLNLAVVLTVSFLFLTLAACKKESTTPNTPSDQNFSGCQLTNIDDEAVSYNADGTIKAVGYEKYFYEGNKLTVTSAGFDFVYTLNNKKYPTSGYMTDGFDSILLSYTYNSSDYLTNLKMDAGAETIECRYEYASGNLSKMTVYEEGFPTPLFTITYTYGTKLDSRKSFFERVMYYETTDNWVGFYAGRANNNLVHRFTVEEDGVTDSYLMSYEFDDKGNVIKATSSDEGGTSGSDKTNYRYTCK